MHTFHWPQLSHMIKPSYKMRRGMWHFLWMAIFPGKYQSFVTKEGEDGYCVASSCFYQLVYG